VLLKPLPLVLDLDGTLIHTDTFHEMMVCLLTRKPWLLLWIPFWFCKGRAYAKHRLAEVCNLNPADLPYNQRVLNFAKEESKTGRPLILATGTTQKVAQRIANYIGIFQDVIGSDEHINMTGLHKKKALLDRFGPQGFDYAGDSHKDIHIWEVASNVLVVHPKWRVLKCAQALHPNIPVFHFPREKSAFLTFLLVLRPLFWLCNFETSSWGQFVGLSLLSSGLFTLGDVLTLYRERQGSFKKSAFAQGHLQLLTAFMLVPLLTIPPLVFFPALLMYCPLLIGIDLLTRSQPQYIRWFFIGLIQLLWVHYFFI
jgi:phosphoserine phosphatase